MSNNFQFLDIILFAMIAAFLILRLRSVLGRHKDSGKNSNNDKREAFSSDKSSNNANDNIVKLPNPNPDGDAINQDATPETPLDHGIKQIKMLDAEFSLEEFLGGAQTAFEMIISAFSRGAKEDLEPLLSKDVYDNFLRAIKDREAVDETLENTLVRIVDCQIIEAELAGNDANITTKIVSEQINVTRNSNGEVVGGDADHISTVTDIWTFSRDVGSQDPNWLLIATRSVD